MSVLDRFTGVTPRGLVNAGQLATGFLPGTVPQVMNVGLDGVEANLEIGDEQRRLRRFGIDAERERHRSNILRRTVADWRSRVVRRLGRSGTAAVGAVAGGGLATAACAAALGPPGWLIGLGIGSAGALAGGFAANKACDAVCTADEKNTAVLITEIAEAQQAHDQVPAEIVSVALAGHLPERKRLAVHRAWAQGDHRQLARLMRHLDTDIRAAIGMPLDPDRPQETAAEYYAGLINSGQMNARDLLYPDRLQAASLLPRQEHYAALEDPVPPSTPTIAPARNGRPRAA